MENNKILYFYTSWSTFVAKDVEILKSQYKVVLFEFNPPKKPQTPFWFIKQLLFLIANLKGTILLVSQFGGYHSFLPALMSKLSTIPSLLVAGGTDCVAFPKIYYGNLRKGMLGFFTKWSHIMSTTIAPVDETLVHYKYQYKKAETTYQYQGIKAHIPNIKTPIKVIYNGYEDFFKKDNVNKNDNTFITIASGIERYSRYTLKGIDLFIELARELPNSSFIIIGAHSIPEETPDNVKLLPFVPNDQLVKYLEKSRFYLQLSMSEGFPNALCEAMTCECVPIVSNVGAMPNIVQKNGIIISEKNVHEIKTAIVKFTQQELQNIGSEARKSILTRYPLSNRRNQLLSLVSTLAQNKKS